jgi:hypothetical protein
VRSSASSFNFQYQILLYGSENWTITARDARLIIAAAEMKYMRTAGHTWIDHNTSTAIATELNMTRILEKCRTTRGIGYNM